MQPTSKPAVSTFLILALSVIVSSSHLVPSVLPLIVRNPYLSTWLPDARHNPWESWPMFWTGEHVGFSVLARLPHERTTYPLLGRAHDSLREDDGYSIAHPHYVGSQFDASTTNLTYQIHPGNASTHLEVTLSFLSPVTPTSTFRQSIPAAYLSVYVTGEHDLDIYIDLNGQWVSGDRGNNIVWDIEHTEAEGENHGLKSWIFGRETEQLFSEIRDQAEWGKLVFTGPEDVRHEAGTSAELRQRFARTSDLQNRMDDKARAIMDDEPVFAFAKSFHQSNFSDTNADRTRVARFTIAHIQDPVVQYAAARGLTLLRPLWASYINSPAELIRFHYFDFPHALALSSAYSHQLTLDATKSSPDSPFNSSYADILSLSARQVLGATHFLGTPDDPLLFMKEISSDGNTQTIDVIFPAFPFFLYTNPRWLAYLLEPLIEHMMSGQYPNKYAMHDIGAHYPNATGHPDGKDEYMPVEECGNILIMGLALVNSLLYDTGSSSPAAAATSMWRPSHKSIEPRSDKIFPLTIGYMPSSNTKVAFLDEPFRPSPQSHRQASSFVKRSYPLWTQWTSYLTNYSLYPENQLSTDDFAGWLALQSNLALKGIIGIHAMSHLSAIAGYDNDAQKYENISRTYIAKWEEYALSRDGTHVKLAYDWFGSWTQTYNLYADSLLCFHLEGTDKQPKTPFPSNQGTVSMRASKQQRPILASPSTSPDLSSNKSNPGFVPHHIYRLQSTWYQTALQHYGLPLDSRHLYTKTDWSLFSASVASPHTHHAILHAVARYVNETDIDRPLSDLHDTETNGDQKAAWPRDGPRFFARPVVGGHFAGVALGRACAGQAVGGLDTVFGQR